MPQHQDFNPIYTVDTLISHVRVCLREVWRNLPQAGLDRMALDRLSVPPAEHCRREREREGEREREKDSFSSLESCLSVCLSVCLSEPQMYKA